MSAYHAARQLALRIRDQYGLTTARIMKTDLRRIYRDRGIQIDYWDHKLNLKVSSQTTMSYAALCKIAERLDYCERGAFAKTKFRNREEELYGAPLYKRIRRNRRKA